MKLVFANLCVFALAAIHTASAAEKPQIQLRGAISLEGDNHADFFPKSAESEMAEESEDKNKKNKSQKSQDQRDARRKNKNPNRSKKEEENERKRKEKQAKNSGNKCRDPNAKGCGGDDEYGEKRRSKRFADCKNRCKTYASDVDDCIEHECSGATAQEKVFPWKEAETAQDHSVEWSKDKYFPKSDESEMAEESEDESKKSSSQKRQEQRDARRDKTNPNRSQDEERAERQRKSNQSKRSGNRCRDPSEPGCGDDDHPRSREATRKNNCERKGTQCEYHRVSPNHEPNSNRRSRDFDCIESCEDDAYDDYDDDVYADEVATACKRRECTGTKWSFNGAATYGEYLDLLLEEINAEPKESLTAQE